MTTNPDENAVTITMTAHLQSADQLRDCLDSLNEQGQDDRCAGIDSIGQPFLACLSGVYASSERVILADPADVERDQGDRCGECGQTIQRHGLDALRYPVTVLLPTGGMDGQ